MAKKKSKSIRLSWQLPNDGRLLAEDRVLFVGEENCLGLEGTESTLQGSLTATWKPGSE